MNNHPQPDSKKLENMDSKKRKGILSEDDMLTVFQRYSAKTVIAFLQEISQSKFNNGKIDWSEIAKKQSIGITCPRECQMLWRHLAYHHPLQENLEEDAEPLDDDSDLEYEMESSPPIIGEAATESFEYVKKWIHMKTRNTGTTITHKKSTIIEDQSSTWQALSMAIDQDRPRSSSALCSGRTNTGSISGSIFSAAKPDAASFSLQKVPNQSQQTLSQAISQKIGSSLLNKPWTGQVRAPTNMTPRTGSNTMIQKAAIAAGGRIAPAETAASLFKAAQSRNVVHIRPGGAVSVSAAPTKSSTPIGPHPSVPAQTLSSSPVSSSIISSVSGTGSQMAKSSTARPTIQPIAQSFSIPTLLQQPCKQTLEKAKPTVCISSSTQEKSVGTACTLPKGATAAPKAMCSTSTVNEDQMSVVDLEIDERDSSINADDKDSSPKIDRQLSSEMPINGHTDSPAVSGYDDTLPAKVSGAKQITLQNQSQDTDLQEDKKPQPHPTSHIDGYGSVDGEGKDKCIISMEKKPNEGCSQASFTQDLIDGQDKKVIPTACVLTSAEVGMSDVMVEDMTEELVTPAGTANENGMDCIASTDLENAESAVQKPGC